MLAGRCSAPWATPPALNNIFFLYKMVLGKITRRAGGNTNTLTKSHTWAGCGGYLSARSPSTPRTLHLGTLAKASDRNRMGTAHQCLLVILWTNVSRKPPGRKSCKSITTANTHTLRTHSVPSVTREVQVTAPSDPPGRMGSKGQTGTGTGARKAVEELEPHAAWGRQDTVARKSTRDPATPRVTHTQKWSGVLAKTFMWIFTAALLLVVKKVEQYKHPPTDEGRTKCGLSTQWSIIQPQRGKTDARHNMDALSTLYLGKEARPKIRPYFARVHYRKRSGCMNLWTRTWVHGCWGRWGGQEGGGISDRSWVQGFFLGVDESILESDSVMTVQSVNVLNMTELNCLKVQLAEQFCRMWIKCQ
jgi:hypothetical protein